MDDYRAQNAETVRAFQRGDSAALAELWERNRPLVAVYMMRLYTAHRRRAEAAGVTLDDLIQEGIFAVRAAAARYDPAAGGGFAHYLYYHCQNTFNKAVGLRTARDRGDPLNREPRSLAEPVPGADDVTYEGIIEDPAALDGFEAAEAQIYNEQIRRVLDDALASLPENWAEVIRLHYYDGLTFRQVGITMGRGWTVVREWERKAMQQLRGKREIRRLREDISDEVEARAYHPGFYSTALAAEWHELALQALRERSAV